MFRYMRRSQWRHKILPKQSVSKLRVNWLSALEAFGIALVVTGALYSFRVIGAGDSKLFTVTALFMGLGYLPAFGLATVLVGGVIALALMVGRWTLLMVGRWTLKQIRREVLEHHGSLPHLAQD